MVCCHDCAYGMHAVGQFGAVAQVELRKRGVVRPRCRSENVRQGYALKASPGRRQGANLVGPDGLQATMIRIRSQTVVGVADCENNPSGYCRSGDLSVKALPIGHKEAFPPLAKGGTLCPIEVIPQSPDWTEGTVRELPRKRGG